MTNQQRCAWCSSNKLYIDYHDTEWGVPVHDDRQLFEMLILEGAQAGLNWLTILKKREGYRLAFDSFDIDKVAAYDQAKIDELITDARIVRNKLKINATVNNAQRFKEVQKEFESFSNYIWQFVDNKPIINQFTKMEDVPAKTPLSDAISKDLKKRGFKFVGSTIIYAYMQAIGMVNDHDINCFRHQQLL